MKNTDARVEFHKRCEHPDHDDWRARCVGLFGRKTSERNYALLIVGGLASFTVLRSQLTVSTFNTSCRTGTAITFRLQ